IKMVGVRVGDEHVGIANGIADGNQLVLERGSPPIRVDQRVDEQGRLRELQAEARPCQPPDAQAVRLGRCEDATARQQGGGRQAGAAGQEPPTRDGVRGDTVVVAHARTLSNAIAVSREKTDCATMTSKLCWCHSRSKAAGSTRGARQAWMGIAAMRSWASRGVASARITSVKIPTAAACSRSR